MPEYRTPGVYIEEISAGPRPVQASSTTETGFVGVLTLPESFVRGSGSSSSMFLPASEEQVLLSWNRALAFRPLLLGAGAPAADAGAAAAGDGKDAKAKKGAPEAGGNKFEQLVSEVLPGKWSIEAPASDAVVMRSDKGAILKVPVRRTLMSVKVDEKGDRKWDLAFGADEQQMLQLIAGHAANQGVEHTGSLPNVDPKSAVAKIDVAAIQSRLQGTAQGINGMDGWEAWLNEFAGKLFVEVLIEADPKVSQNNAELVWDTLGAAAKKAWMTWLRTHPGIRRYELSLSGFFENGGKTAFLAMCVQAHGAAGPNKRKFLMDSFDGVSAVAMLVAPGLNRGWQQAILEYAGPRGRGDLFAIMDTPRYLLTKEPRGQALDDQRWTADSGPYEVAALQTLGTPKVTELRFGGYSADELLDRTVPRDDTGYGAAYGPWIVVDNPLSTGPHDRYVIAPPAGHMAGVVAATDLKPGGGVHKAPANEQMVGLVELVTNISDREQEALNVKGINIIRHRGPAGIRVWGARTIAADPLWTYISVRRLFLFVERSVRDAVQWAVFLPNVEATRGDLKVTIAGFLYRLWSQGMLDGSSWQEAFSVQCDRENNPDVDVRSGLLTVDVQIRPVYPAEFVRIRFRQSPMQSDVSEG